MCNVPLCVCTISTALRAYLHTPLSYQRRTLLSSLAFLPSLHPCASIRRPNATLVHKRRCLARSKSSCPKIYALPSPLPSWNLEGRQAWASRWLHFAFPNTYSLFQQRLVTLTSSSPKKAEPRRRRRKGSRVGREGEK